MRGFWSNPHDSYKIKDMSAATTRPAAEPPPETAGPPAEILIVDNDQSHAETVAESLQRVGFRCHVATSGREGAKLVEEREFDAIITDLKMNDVDGLQILELAKDIAARHRGHPAHRFRLDPLGRRGDAERGLQLSHQAAGHGPASRGDRSGRSTARGCGGRTSN